MYYNILYFTIHLKLYILADPLIQWVFCDICFSILYQVNYRITVLSITILHYINRTIPMFCTILYGTILYYTTICYTTLHFTIHYIVLYYSITILLLPCYQYIPTLHFTLYFAISQYYSLYFSAVGG